MTTETVEKTYHHLLVSVEDKIEIIIFNRPKVLNALNKELLDELEAELDCLANNTEVEVVILTGSGEKAFVAGADINEVRALTAITGLTFSHHGNRIMAKIENLNKPVIAAVNGFALGGGCEVALACDIRIASENARFGQPEVNLGLIPGYGGSQRLPRIIGKGRAMELILTGDMVDAQEAYRIGLVNKVVEKEKLLDTAKEMAKKIISKGPVSVKMGKKMINRGLNMALDDALCFEANAFGFCCGTFDKNEGTGAFLEKRKPAFKGE